MRSWLGRFVLACGTISSAASVPSAAQTPPPTIVLADSADLAQWQTWTKDAGWNVIGPAAAPGADIDTRALAIEKSTREAIQSGVADPARVFLGGRGNASSAVFYVVSRVPDLWAAAVALGGSPQPAIDTGRIYAANFSQVPVLWVGAAATDQATAETLRSEGIPLEWRAADVTNVAAVLEWLGRHTRAAYPTSIDCETSSPSFAGCYWIAMTKFDAAERNDVLPSTRLQPNNRAALDLGGFGFKTDDPGPGVLVGYLPEKYSGPLKMGDRIVALDGRAIPDARRYVELMAKVAEERPAVATIQRGRERIRIETRLVLPKPAPGVTARLQAQYIPGEKQIQIVSRTVTEMRVTVPPQWVPSVLNWNGVGLEKIETPGCRLLIMEKALERTGPCL